MAKGGSRWGAGRKATRVRAEDCTTIDVHRWQRHGGLESGEHGTWYVDGGKPIHYSVEGDGLTLNHSLAGDPLEQVVPLMRTIPRYGGERVYFGCPKCDRRCVLLYLRPRAGFICRECAGLVYASQRAAAYDRVRRLQAKIERRLGPYRSRPLGMHQATYDRLLNRLARAELESVELLRVAWEKVRPTWKA